jgi:hypothetical protein
VEPSIPSFDTDFLIVFVDFDVLGMMVLLSRIDSADERATHGICNIHGR